MALVSVIIPTYNRSKLVAEAIDSVLRQTMRDLEVIVVDDGSTDETLGKVESISDTRLRYFYKENGGVSSARNLGLKHATGQYICFLDSDDLWPEDFLKVMTDALEKNPDYGAAYCARALTYPDGDKIESYEREYCGSGRLTEALFNKSFMQTSTLCFRKAALDGFSFERSLKNSEDRDAWLRISTKIRFLFIPSVQIIYRVGHGVSPIDASAGSYNRILVLERFYFRLGGDKYISRMDAFRKISHACRTVAEFHRHANNRTAALWVYKRAISYWPLDVRLYSGLIKVLLQNKKSDKMRCWQPPEPLPDIAATV